MQLDSTIGEEGITAYVNKLKGDVLKSQNNQDEGD